MSIFTDSIAIADAKVSIEFLAAGTNRWILRATNTGSMFLCFFPQGLTVAAGRDADLKAAALTAQSTPFLNPGESVDFDFHLESSAEDSSRKKVKLYYSVSGMEQRWHSEYLP